MMEWLFLASSSLPPVAPSRRPVAANATSFAALLKRSDNVFLFLHSHGRTIHLQRKQSTGSCPFHSFSAPDLDGRTLSGRAFWF